MSLVGPRPDPAFYIEYYHGNDYDKLAMRPGLTALSHVLGRQTIPWRKRFAIERCYIEHYSLWLDLKIIMRTPLIIYQGTGVNNPTDQAADVVPSHSWLQTVCPGLSGGCLQRGNASRQGATRAVLQHARLVAGLVLLLTLLTAPQSARAVVQIEKISPVLECVEAKSDGSYTAHFGYYNRNNFTVDFPVGSDNAFAPAPQGRGQPTSFLPGRQVDVFRVDFDGSRLVWRLYGKTSTASAASHRCPEPFIPARRSDFAGNGSVDLFWRHQNTGDNGLWLMEGSERLSAAPLNTVDDLDWQVMALEDLNGDQRADLLWRHMKDGRQVAWLMDGSSRLEVAGLNTVPELEWQIVGLHDFDGNSRADILWRNRQTGGSIIWSMNGVSRSGLVGLNMVSDTDWQIVGLHDFDGNGSPDLLWRHARTGDTIIWFFEGTTRTYVHGTRLVSDQAWQIIGGGDFDGDGKADIFWRNTETGANVLWLMDGYTRTALASLPTVSDQSWQVVTIDDFDGDHKDDLLWRNRTDGSNSIWTIDGTTRTAIVSLNQVDDVAWEIVGTEAARNSSRIAHATTATVQQTTQAPHASLARSDTLVRTMVDEQPGAVMPDEGMSSPMPIEPITAIPDSMEQTRVFLPLIRH
jgi:hypothetical protein